MKKTLLALSLVLLGLGAVSSQDASSIVRASRDRITATTVSTSSRMVIAARDGTTSERALYQYSSDGPKGDRTMIVFLKPQSVAGTRFLTLANEDSVDDRWIFLPSLGKIRRIASAEGSGSFMGTDFSYDDVSSTNRDVSLDTHQLVREESLSGVDCWVIESTPKDSSYQYSRLVSWIEKKTHLVRKIELYDRKGNFVKLLEVLKVQDVQGRLTPTVTRMTTVAEKSSTTINVDIIKYDEKIPEGVFTTDYLSTGRLK